MRADFDKKENSIGIEYLNTLIKDVDSLEKQYLNKQGLVDGARTPDYILSEIFYHGLKEGLIEKDGKSYNSLKLAQDFFATRFVCKLEVIVKNCYIYFTYFRLALAIQASESMKNQQRICRKYYTMIKARCAIIFKIFSDVLCLRSMVAFQD